MTRVQVSPTKLWTYVRSTLRLDSFFRRPGDQRLRPQIPARDLVWSQVLARVLRTSSFHGLETLVHSTAPSSLHISRRFSEDTLGYFDERLDPAPTRQALANTLKLAKRNKAFHGEPWIGLALDGTSAGKTSRKAPLCKLCRPVKDGTDQVVGHRHELSMASVVGKRLRLPFDVEPYGPGDCELNASRRLLARSVAAVGPRFVQYVVADAKYGAASFLNDVIALGLDAVVRLKDNLPDLHARAVARFNARPPDLVQNIDGRQVELWDDDDFLPWEGLNWESVRVFRYRYRTKGGEDFVEAYWLTSLPKSRAGSTTLFELAKTRWAIENEGFNEAKTRLGMEHICRHDANAVLVSWLLMLLALVILTLYRLCHLHRGSHEPHPAAELVTLLWVALGRPAVQDSS